MRQRFVCWNQRNLAVGSFGLVPANAQDAALEIYVRPGYYLSLAQPATGVGKEPAKVRRVAGHSPATPFDFDEDFRELRGLR